MAAFEAAVGMNMDAAFELGPGPDMQMDVGGGGGKRFGLCQRFLLALITLPYTSYKSKVLFHDTYQPHPVFFFFGMCVFFFSYPSV